MEPDPEEVPCIDGGKVGFSPTFRFGWPAGQARSSGGGAGLDEVEANPALEVVPDVTPDRFVADGNCFGAGASAEESIGG